MTNINMKMKNLVEISSLVTESTNFFDIKDKIVEKMLEVVFPRKACVNLFYNNDYKNAYLVCSNSLEYIRETFKPDDAKGVKFDFYEDYPDYIHDAVEFKKIIYIQNVFDDERAIKERDLAKHEKYTGRIVFPLIYNKKVVGFMTCFLDEEDILKSEDIDFVSSIASLIALSIEITEKNSQKNFVIDKLRSSLELISEATRKLYQNKNIDEFLVHLSDIAKKTTKSRDAVILIDKNNWKTKIFRSYCKLDEKDSSMEDIVNLLLSKNVQGKYVNDRQKAKEINLNVDTYIFYKLSNESQSIGVILCIDGKKYEDDDLNILSILSKQVTVAMQLYDYSEKNIKHKLIAKELNILNKQQKLIMNDSKMECNNEKELEFYHKPATVVGGDFYYAHKIDDKRVAFIIADVMGHGIVANYMVAMIKGAFKTLCYQYKTPGEIATHLNKILYDEFDKMGVFATALINVFDTQRNILSVSNAGHYSPIIIDENDEVVESLNCKKGIPIGVLPDGEYHSNTFSIENYPMVFMFTDGTLEIKNHDKEEFGLDRLKCFVKNNYKNNKNKIVENLKKETEKFTGNDNFDDDILILMLKNI
ncbi:GAF domain-containing SpoIIE family protein phosphatase [Terrisporobacter vanillatitrophus]|uniref:GAF domain-containing SpoIIE family protein phosphatase n=1 Tax=Terrisporobacter vanillatitrophus TaxID=3058402 RepID=UPI003EB867DF